ncbi:hypothetical protein J3R83DRAFT_9031 [Lanmaoa asiatica]|nr:hypothetical protein J3R83DRAFT_9031 [Lanmaoa asiatica]
MGIFRPSPQNLVGGEPVSTTSMPSERWRQILPMTHQDTRGPTITCYDDFENPTTHGTEPRYVSPTTGECRKLVIQSVRPNAPNECSISDHTGRVSKLAIWLLSTNPFHPRVFLKWTGTWLLFEFKLFWYFIWLCAQLLAQLFMISLPEDSSEDSEVYNTGSYKPYSRGFRGQLWAARSKKEYSTRVEDEDNKDGNIPTHTLYPRLLMIRNPTGDEWSPCMDPSTIMSSKYIAISYPAADVYTSGPNEKREKELFVQEVRSAVVQQNFDAYWLDLECIGETPDEKNLDLYCMADVYRIAESTLIILGNSQEGEEDAWRRWGGRVWTLPEALLSHRLLYKFRDGSEIKSVSLHQLANLAYPRHAMEQAIINAYSGKDPLERLERLSLLKSAIWRRGVKTGTPFLSSAGTSIIEKTPPRSGPHAAERVYALMGFFEHRIEPNYGEDDLRALVRLSMANDNDRIPERMVSLSPSIISPNACWYADDDIYDTNLWDIYPEVHVAGVTENGALVLDGCSAACIRWKDFPQIAFDKTDSVRRSVIGFIPYLAWPILIVGIVAVAIQITAAGGIALIVVGLALLLASPKLFVISESGRVLNPQPWFIGVKGVLDIDAAATHLYGGSMGRYPRLEFTPSGSEFAVPDRGPYRGGSKEQYDKAKKAEAEGGQIYTLIDTGSSTIYYFRADKPPTVCLFTGREGGLGRFVLCSERCGADELHKEAVLRMPTEVSQDMNMCGWIALG